MKEITLLQWLVVGCLAALGIAIWSDMVVMKNEREQWRTFSAANDCKRVAYKQASCTSGTGFGTAGGHTGVVITSQCAHAQEAFVCKDGVTYWRDAR